MTAVAILFELDRSGFTITLEGGNLRIMPASSLTPERRALIVSNKAAIVSLLANAHETTVALLAAIDAACDARGDDAKNRAALKEDCRHLAAHEQGDMLEHFSAEAALWEATDPAAETYGDDRRGCNACWHGRSARCPDGAPLPANVLHRCARFAPAGDSQ